VNSLHHQHELINREPTAEDIKRGFRPITMMLEAIAARASTASPGRQQQQSPQAYRAGRAAS
jgi:hypothetical protein